MRTRTRITGLISFSLLWATATLNAQVTVESNTITTTNDFVGCDVNSTVPLQVRHDANFRIEWYTNALRRMLLSPTLTGQSVNGYTGLDLSGHLGVGPFAAPVFTPLAMLHLDSAGTQVTGYRPWMGTGTIMTKRSDMMYVGLKRQSEDRNDAVIGWADNIAGDTASGPDRLRFIFTRRPVTPPNQIVEGYEGLEIARMLPDATGNEGFLGVGDWNTAGVEPTERLDVLDGKVRIRELPTDAISTSNEYVTVNTTTGVLEHRPLPPYATSGCEWNENAASNRLTTATAAVGTNPGCPELDWKIGIGTSAPTWKLQVEHNSNATPGFGGGMYMGLVGSGGAAVAQGIRANVTQPATLTTEGQAIRGEYSNP